MLDRSRCKYIGNEDKNKKQRRHPEKYDKIMVQQAMQAVKKYNAERKSIMANIEMTMKNLIKRGFEASFF